MTFCTDDHLQIHRGQGRLSEVLLEDAGEATRSRQVGLRRSRGVHDLKAQGLMWLRVHVQAAAHVPGCVGIPFARLAFL